MKNLDKGIVLGFVRDLLLSLIASLFAILLLRWVTAPIGGFTFLIFKWLGLSLVASFIAFFVSKYYKRDRDVVSRESILHLVVAVFIKDIVLTLFLLLGFVSFPIVADAVLLLFTDVLFTLLICQYVRISQGAEVRRIRSLSAARTALVVGTDEAAVQMANDLNEAGNFNVVGLVSQNRNMNGRIIGNYTVYYVNNPAAVDHLKWKIGGIDCIFFPRANAQNSIETELSNDQKLLTEENIAKLDAAAKRSFDIVVSFILLVIFSPLILICGIAVKMEDGGPAFYRQERIGMGGRKFKLVKFRSMRTDAESMGTPALCCGEADPRLTRVGRFIRAHHLDELPQMWNVLVGDMSFVGWRPEREFFVKQIMERDSRFQYLYQIRPGVTSFATVYNGYTDTMEKMLTRLDQDIYYLRSRSIAFDAKILMLTFLNIVSGKKF